MGVKDEFLTSFVDVSKSEAAKKCSVGMGYSLGVIFPIFIKSLNSRYLKPVIPSMDRAVEYMGICRTQRQADEKGLSAFSCGVGASGNPTKMQLRWQRKLALILGALATNSGSRVMIFDNTYSELEALHLTIQEWVKNVPCLKNKPYVFFCDATAGMSQKLAGHITSSTVLMEGDSVLILSAVAAESAKATEWSKIDTKIGNKIVELFDSKGVDQVGFTMLTHVISERYFKTIDEAVSDDIQTYVYNLGSIHNMYGVVSTFDNLSVASCNGEHAFSFEVDEKKPLTVTEFYNHVVNHNLARSGFMLNPRFYFNKNLNFLRKLPGKTISFVDGSVDDGGIDIETDVSNMGRLGEGVEDEDTYYDHEVPLHVLGPANVPLPEVNFAIFDNPPVDAQPPPVNIPNVNAALLLYSGGDAPLQKPKKKLKAVAPKPAEVSPPAEPVVIGGKIDEATF